jgi:hypothetical protein
MEGSNIILKTSDAAPLPLGQNCKSEYGCKVVPYVSLSPSWLLALTVSFSLLPLIDFLDVVDQILLNHNEDLNVSSPFSCNRRIILFLSKFLQPVCFLNRRLKGVRVRLKMLVVMRS